MSVRRSRAGSLNSISQTNLPYGARAHRPSWNLSPTSGADDDAERVITPIDMGRTVSDEDVIPSPTKKGSRSRTSSLRSNTNPLMVHPQMSTDSLRVGADVSTRDTIGNVPMPSVRARSSTHGSWRGSRNSTPVYDLNDMLAESHSQPPSQRASRLQPLTPAQEKDEWPRSP